MSARKWHKGPPPGIGWYNASRVRDEEIWRWRGNGWWSAPVDSNEPAKNAAKRAKLRDHFGDIEWTTYWPKGARVERPK